MGWQRDLHLLGWLYGRCSSLRQARSPGGPRSLSLGDANAEIGSSAHHGYAQQQPCTDPDPDDCVAQRDLAELTIELATEQCRRAQLSSRSRSWPNNRATLVVAGRSCVAEALARVCADREHECGRERAAPFPSRECESALIASLETIALSSKQRSEYGGRRAPGEDAPRALIARRLSDCDLGAGDRGVPSVAGAEDHRVAAVGDTPQRHEAQ